MLSIKFGIHPCSQHHFKPPCPQTPSAPDSTEYDFPLISVPNPTTLTFSPTSPFLVLYVCVCVVWPPPPPAPTLSQSLTSISSLPPYISFLTSFLPSRSSPSHTPHPPLLLLCTLNRLPAHPHQHPHLCLSDYNQHSSEDRSYNHEWIRRQSTWKHTPERLWMPNTHLKRKHTYATEGSGLLSHFKHSVSSCEIRFNPFTADKLYHWCSFLPRSLSRKGWTD